MTEKRPNTRIFPRQPQALLRCLASWFETSRRCTTILGTRFVKRGITEPVTAAQLIGWHAILGLLEKANALFVGKSALLDVRLAPI